MTVLIVDSPRLGAAGSRPTPPQAPVRPDGAAYRYEMIFDGDKSRAYADATAELCRVLIPDYEDEQTPTVTPESQLADRLIFAVTVQVRLQAAILADYASLLPDGPEQLPGRLDLSEDAWYETLCTKEEWAILTGPRHVPPQLPVPGAASAPAPVWECPIPLVLVKTYYQAGGGKLPTPEGSPRDGNEPESNLRWLDPGSEWGLLVSLHNAGFIRLNVSNRLPTAASPGSKEVN